VFFKKCSKPINNFCEEFCIAKSKMAILSSKNFRDGHQKCKKKVTNSEKLLMYGQILNVITTTLFTIWYNIVMNETKHGHNVYKTWIGYEIFSMLVYFVQIFIILFGPMSCTAELLICEIIEGLSEMFEDWQRVLRCNLALIELNEDETEEFDNESFKKDRKECEK